MSKHVVSRSMDYELHAATAIRHPPLLRRIREQIGRVSDSDADNSRGVYR